ncbi:MAG: hypothetical protein QOF18_1503 [Frankiaceae bacterium]|jgi:hypothetical protein|nr:hypothetical protein [Frankiaceae bacterium]
MKRIMRSAVLAGAAVTGIALGTTGSAYAQGAGVFQGTAHINCFGCGSSSGTATLKVTGELGGTAMTQAAVSADYSVTEAAGTCPAVGSATGNFSGAINGTFTWTRVGATAVITTAGDIKGDGIAAFAVTSPAGLPCGGPVTASVAGSVAGT